MAAQAKSQRIVIKPIDERFLKLHIRGTSPLCTHRFGSKARGILVGIQEEGDTNNRAKKKPREKKDFEAEFKDATYTSPEGWHGVNASAFRHAAIAAGRVKNFTMTKMKQAIFIVEDGRDAAEDTALVRIIADEPENWIKEARNKNGSTDLRARPLWKKWEMIVTVRYNAEILTASDVVNLFHHVGRYVGIGEGRPDSRMSAGMDFGLFELVND